MRLGDDCPAAFVGFGLDKKHGLFEKLCPECGDYKQARAEATNHGVIVVDVLCQRHVYERTCKRFAEHE